MKKMIVILGYFQMLLLNEDEYMLLWASNKNRGQLTYPRTLINQGDTFRYITT